MDRIDDCTVKRTLVSHPTLPLVSGARSENVVQISSEPFAHFVCGAIGEGYSNDLIDIEILVLAQDVKISLDENRGFTRAWPGCYRHMPVKRIRRGLLFGF